MVNANADTRFKETNRDLKNQVSSEWLTQMQIPGLQSINRVLLKPGVFGMVNSNADTRFKETNRVSLKSGTFKTEIRRFHRQTLIEYWRLFSQLFREAMDN
jgi:hypothetical protein